MKRRIIINADDFGLSKKFNKGIVELAKEKLVTSTSVMIKRKFVNPSKLLAIKDISIGLHLELAKNDTQKEIERQIEKFKKKFRRLPSHLDSHKHCHLTKNNLPRVIKSANKYHIPVRSVSSKDRRILKKYKIKTPSRFISWHPARKEELVRKLKGLKSSVTELVCHPGYWDKASKSSYNKQREQELNFLRSKEFRKVVRKFDTVNYHEI